MMLSNKNRQKGFTLTELIVVIIISGIFFALISTVTVTFTHHYRDAVRNGEKLAEVNLISDFYNDLFNHANLHGKTIKINDDINQLMADDLYTIGYDQNSKKITYKESTTILKYINNLDIKISGKNIYLTIFCSDERTYEKIYSSIYNIEDVRNKE